MKYYLIALTFAVVARAQPVADISCAVSCLSDVVITGECKPRHFDCVIRQCDAAVSLDVALATISDLCMGLDD